MLWEKHQWQLSRSIFFYKKYNILNLCVLSMSWMGIVSGVVRYLSRSSSNLGVTGGGSNKSW